MCRTSAHTALTHCALCPCAICIETFFLCFKYSQVIAIIIREKNWRTKREWNWLKDEKRRKFVDCTRIVCSIIKYNTLFAQTLFLAFQPDTSLIMMYTCCTFNPYTKQTTKANTNNGVDDNENVQTEREWKKNRKKIVLKIVNNMNHGKNYALNPRRYICYMLLIFE